MHARAVELFDLASAEHWGLVTTNVVVVETYSVLLARARDGRRAAISFLDAVEASGALTVERVRTDDESAAADLVRAHTDKSYSLCDAQSLSLWSVSISRRRLPLTVISANTVASRFSEGSDPDDVDRSHLSAPMYCG